MPAGWLIDFYNHMTTPKGKEIIENGWKAAGIYDAIKVGSIGLPPIDPFNDIEPMLYDAPDQTTTMDDVSVDEFELIIGRSLAKDVGYDIDDSAWEEEEEEEDDE